LTLAESDILYYTKKRSVEGGALSKQQASKQASKQAASSKQQVASCKQQAARLRDYRLFVQVEVEVDNHKHLWSHICQV
jgi:transposase